MLGRSLVLVGLRTRRILLVFVVGILLVSLLGVRRLSILDRLAIRGVLIVPIGGDRLLLSLRRVLSRSASLILALLLGVAGSLILPACGVLRFLGAGPSGVIGAIPLVLGDSWVVDDVSRIARG